MKRPEDGAWDGKNESNIAMKEKVSWQESQAFQSRFFMRISLVFSFGCFDFYRYEEVSGNGV